MNDLDLPIIKAVPAEKRILSMDDYLKFVQFNITHAFDRKAYEELKKKMRVNVRFILD